jgi:hypothetical protein
VKAPRTIRLIVDCDGRIVSGPIEGRNEATRTRNRIHMEHFGGHPFAVATYDLRPPGGKRALITLPPPPTTRKR